LAPAGFGDSGFQPPMAAFAGQILNAGHLAQPTAIAMGHIFIVGLPLGRLRHGTPAE
jgi:hypothetical protein